jgi:hypothetical protein
MKKKLKLNNMIGVFSSNTIPSITQIPNTFICNLSTEKIKGTHFIAIYENYSSFFYFDPFGKTCTNTFILEYMKSKNKIIYYNNIVIQSLFSTFCGFFTLGFCICIERNENIVNFLKMFVNNLDQNDEIITEYIIRNI